MSLWLQISLVIFAYLIGAIPFGYIFTRRYTGKSIFELGSGNIGSTNVRRIAGKKIAAFTQVCDMLKGLLPVTLVYFLQLKDFIYSDEYYLLLVALATILGHDFSIYLKFKGGKGVNTTLGASLILAPYSVLISVLFYFVIKWKFKIVSIGSIVIAFSLPVVEFLFHRVTVLFYYLLVCSVLIVVKHIPNMKRILNGTETKSE